MDKFWVDSPSSNPGSSYDRNQAYGGPALDDEEYGFGKKKSARDPMSHRIIEKRRRDRMNNCLADLSRLLPTAYMKKGRGRIEKTEIIEMAIRHLRHLQAHACQNEAKCEIVEQLDRLSSNSDQYKKGFSECMTETVNFLSHSDNVTAPENTCTRLMSHLQQYCDKTVREGSRSETPSHDEYNSTPSTTRADHARSTSSEGPQSSSTGGDSGDSRRGSGSEGSPRPTEKESVSQSTEYEPFCRPDAQSRCQEDRLEENRRFSRRPQDQNSNFVRNDHGSRTGRSQTPNGRHESEGATSPNCSSSSENGAHGSYKFKNNIKQRFAADANVESDFRSESLREQRDFSGGFEQKRPRLHTEDSRKRPAQFMWEPKQEVVERPHHPTASKASVKHYDSPFNRTTSSDASSTSSFNRCQEQSLWPRKVEEQSDPESLPIFALHPKGAFYVPMTIEFGLIAPLLTDAVNCGSSLHHVNIAVNFSVPAKVITARNILIRDPVAKRPPSTLSNELLHSPAETPRNSFPHADAPFPSPWEESDEREGARFHNGGKPHYESAPPVRQDPSDSVGMKRNLRIDQQAMADPSRWSLLMANARR